MADIRHFLRIRVPPAKVREALTTAAGIEGWWVVNAEKNGEMWAFSFGEYGVMQMKIAKEEDATVSWIYDSGSMEDDPWQGTTVTFGLEAEGEDTTIMRFVHSGFDVDQETLDNLNYNWGRFMFSLKAYCETGTGFPVIS